MTKEIKICKNCNEAPIAVLELVLDPIICFSATLKCKSCGQTGPTFDGLQSKVVKDLIEPAVQLWNDSLKNQSSTPTCDEDLKSAIDGWLTDHQ